MPANKPNVAALVEQMPDTDKEIQAQAEEAKQQANDLKVEWKRQSYLGRLGRAIEPAVRPLGWDWRIGMAALASFPAREVFVGTLGVIYQVGEVDPGDINTAAEKTMRSPCMNGEEMSWGKNCVPVR